jgi:RNA polymerase-associated protein LEO1
MSSEVEDFVDEDNLFGDEDEAGTPPPRSLSDRELDSGDDEDREDRIRQDEEIAADQREARVMETDIVPHPIPNPSDGEVSRLLCRTSTII